MAGASLRFQLTRSPKPTGVSATTVSAVPNVRERDEEESGSELEPVRSQLDEQAFVLRGKSLSYRAIAAELGCPVSVAFQRVQRAQMRERQGTPEQIRANMAVQLDEALGRMRELGASSLSSLNAEGEAWSSAVNSSEAGCAGRRGNQGRRPATQRED